MAEAHTIGYHEALKLDGARWAALKYVGIQPMPAYEDEPAEALELRNCTCQSTLARRLP